MGIKNNNPGNIRVSSVKWKGEIPSLTPFEAFSTLMHGYRALISNAYHIIITDKKNTLLSFATTWAPPSENNTANYAKILAKYTGLGINDKIKWTNQFIFDLCVGVSMAENSTYNATAIMDAIKDLQEGGKIASKTEAVDQKKKYM